MDNEECDIDAFAELLENDNFEESFRPRASSNAEPKENVIDFLPDSLVSSNEKHSGYITDTKEKESNSSTFSQLLTDTGTPENNTGSEITSSLTNKNNTGMDRKTSLDESQLKLNRLNKKCSSVISSEPTVSSANLTVNYLQDKISSHLLNGSPENIDPLEKELLIMESKMKKLKEEISKKKNIKIVTGKSDGFTKISSVIDPRCSEIQVQTRTLNATEREQLVKDINQKKSEIHTGDTDSEDDDDNRNPMEPQFTSYGKDMKTRLAHSRSEAHSPVSIRQNKNGWKEAKGGSLLAVGKAASELSTTDSNTIQDPFSGIRIINPLVSTNSFKEMLGDRRMIQMSSISSYLRGGDIEGDWVTIGVIVSKSDTKTSQKGSKYSIWQMSDLRDCTKVASLFLFAGAYKNLWKTTVGSVIGVLNPQIMKESNKATDGRFVMTLSVNTHEKLLLLGTAKDLGWCKGRNKQGSNCRQFVNKNVCEFCIFHIQREYKKMSSQRAEIQSSFTRVDPRKSLQKRVLGKDQVFYGGQLYSSGNVKEATPKRVGSNSSTKAKDLSTLNSLSFKAKVENLKTNHKKDSLILNHLSDDQIESVKLISKDSEELGQMLLAPSPGARNLLLHKTKDPGKQVSTSTPNVSKPLTAKEVLKAGKPSVQAHKGISQLRNEGFQSPLLGRGLSPGEVFEFDCPTSSKKAKAALIVKGRGGLQYEDKNMKRNKEKAASLEFQSNIKKRMRESITDEEGNEKVAAKSSKTENTENGLKNKSLLGSVDLNSEKFIAMMNAKSTHTGLIQAAENEELEKYYNTLEKKEMIENKMASIMEVPTSAVACLKCKYKAISASDRCKTENHPLKFIKALKRFFECRNCKQRTISLEKLPARPCTHCNTNSWKRVAMAKDKQGPKLESEILSLRGDELSNVASASNQIFLNL